jgi:hypothetical protein
MKKLLLIVCAFVLMSAAPHKNMTFNDLMHKDKPEDSTQVEICHKSGQSYVYKLVSAKSLQGHLNHGDFLYRGRPDVELWEMTDWCNINTPSK